MSEVAGQTTAEADAELMAKFTPTMDEDLNVSGAWGVVFEWVRENNRLLAAGQMSPVQAAAGHAAWAKIDSVFGLGAKVQAEEAPPEIQQLLEDRQVARKARDFKRSDAIRDELKVKGWIIEDTPKGARLKRL
jgi:cysteinyl-tRNA synthetase